MAPCFGVPIPKRSACVSRRLLPFGVQTLPQRQEPLRKGRQRATTIVEGKESVLKHTVPATAEGDSVAVSASKTPSEKCLRTAVCRSITGHRSDVLTQENQMLQVPGEFLDRVIRHVPRELIFDADKTILCHWKEGGPRRRPGGCCTWVLIGALRSRDSKQVCHLPIHTLTCCGKSGNMMKIRPLTVASPAEANRECR